MELGLVLPVLGVSIVVGALLRRLGLPSATGFVLGGLASYYLYKLIGADPGAVARDPGVSLLAQVGLALLGFEIGSEFSLRTAPLYIKTALVIEVFTMTLIWLLWGVLAPVLGLGLVEQALMFLLTMNTSTGILYKSMRETWRGPEREYRIVLSASTIEDMVAVVGLSLLIGLYRGRVPTPHEALVMLGELVLLVVSLLSIGVYVFRRVSGTLLRETDYLGLFSLTVAILYSLVTSSLGYTVLLGAFLAGVSAGTSLDPRPLVTHLSVLRDLGLLLYFSLVGLQIPVILSLEDITWPLVVMVVVSILVVLFKSLSFSTSLWLTGIDVREAVRTGLYVSTISEIGIVLSRELYSVGAVSASYIVVSVSVFLVSSLVYGLLVSREEDVSRRVLALLPGIVREVRVQRHLERIYREVSGVLTAPLWYVLGMALVVSVFEYLRALLERPIEGGALYIAAVAVSSSIGVWTWAIYMYRYVGSRLERYREAPRPLRVSIEILRTALLVSVAAVSLFFQLRVLAVVREHIPTPYTHYITHVLEVSVVVAVLLAVYMVVRRALASRA